MSGITGLGTTYNLPNYTGILYALTPADTPFFSAIGGLTGGGQTISKEFEWEGYDLRDAGQNVALEGADAPTAQERVRANFDNIVQIHHETVAVSYSKLAAYGEKAGINNGAQNPVTNEHDWQVRQMLVQMVRDVEYSFINGQYHKPADNTTARQTRGIRQAITTNLQNKGTLVIATGRTATASTDNITATAHGLSDGDRVFLRNISEVGTGLRDDVVYYVVSSATNTFKVSLTEGGSAVDILVNCTVDPYELGTTTPTPEVIGEFLQAVWDNGGISEQGTAALMCGSTQKRKLTHEYAAAYGKADPFNQTRNVGGLDLQTIETDFGVLNIMLNRMMPKHELAVVSLEQCMPVYLETPGKGHFFAEPLAKTGSSDRTQLYGEVGLGYGSQLAHGLLTGLAI